MARRATLYKKPAKVAPPGTVLSLPNAAPDARKRSRFEALVTSCRRSSKCCQLVPRPWTTAIMATEMPAAIRPYSMAVAPIHPTRNV